ncbi:hypothetical protein PENSPDRAFT_595081, partial [Peniophora sp. CONT]
MNALLTEHDGKPLKLTDDAAFLSELRGAYDKDPLFSKVKQNVKQFKNFSLDNDIVYTKNRNGKAVICVPRAVKNKRKLTEKILDETHTLLGHLGTHRTSEYVRTLFWW